MKKLAIRKETILGAGDCAGAQRLCDKLADEGLQDPAATAECEDINKYLQINYGCGTSGFQSVWPDEHTLMKFDEEYAEIYAAASEMGANLPCAPGLRV